MHVTSADKWFPARDSTQVVGAFVDVECDDPVASKKAHKPIKMYVVCLHAKVAGSQEVSNQKVFEHNREDLTHRFPGAMEHYLKRKAALAAAAPEPEELHVSGTPIESSQLFNNDRIAWFKATGIYTMEQVADMSDTTLENAGRSGGTGLRAARKKAREFLASKNASRAA
jgi:hypothetical protein